MERGTVRRVSDAKGFGLVSRPIGGDVLVHFSTTQTDGFRKLQEGQPVLFNVVRGPTGFQAEDVRIA
jgi:cold shock protein